MITSVFETHVSNMSDEGGTFWTYMICIISGPPKRKYNLIRIDSCCEVMERLGCEQSLKSCREIIKSYDSFYKEPKRKKRSRPKATLPRWNAVSIATHKTTTGS